MKKIDFSRHSIADVRDWDNAGRLEIQPDFQRNYVWGAAARIMLIDSILKDIPLPKIFIASKIKDNNTHRIVIDGQQRITSILMFINDEFSLNSPYEGEFYGKKFSDLETEFQSAILQYRLDFNEFEDYSNQEMREIYNRVNKYNLALNKQELRKADFPGDFLTLSEKYAVNPFFNDANIFSTANRRRMGDVEYISELLAVLINGPQDKKTTLDDYYIQFMSWADKEDYSKKFDRILDDLKLIFSNYQLSKTRFRQKSDFYSFFAAISDLHNQGYMIDKDRIDSLVADLEKIDQYVEPGGVGLFGDYATRCLSDANAKASREWRKQFIQMFILGAYKDYGKSEKSQKRFLDVFNSGADTEDTNIKRLTFLSKVMSDLLLDDDCTSLGCPPLTMTCDICEREEEYNPATWITVFPKNEIFLWSAIVIHKDCLKGLESDYCFIENE